mmetsp:Transcript_12249/g.26807  ORF Transcript_12249/g.26807 Transcript_12249/m.26807 type:complete len:349 (-) Transcript_12249:733-1779(-)|eukprot:CAMPEP_0185849330 /NCGR_PEP_ID=MMETSP1354-20130828/3861_1 /TAXON_ID=708628 /ORGANISM="Erythrolobus madagascarensis, Strain CCMP3276" /LENGTH=348 /DNA_ID=CAMNT_0028549831 /DNA_START=38 /DNA_END=1084 /DNA_ORIENTATION=+
MTLDQQAGDSLDWRSTVLANQKPRAFTQRTTIQHWQLRDLVAAARSSTSTHDELFFTQDSTVRRFNTCNRNGDVVLNCGFLPTAMTHAQDVLVTGGPNSQLRLVRSADKRVLYSGSTNGLVTNGVHLSEQSDGGQLRLFVSNNDETVKVFDVDTMRLVSTLVCSCAVNCASVSPDGKFLVAGFDEPFILLFGLTGQGSYELVAELDCPATDAGISCSWSPCGKKFAMAFQDGMVLAYDIRTRGTIAKLCTLQMPSSKGSARCVKFAPRGALDLLAFSEHVNYVHLVDTRGDMSRQQSFRIPSPTRDAPISGISFSPAGETLFVGTDSNILAYDVFTRSRRSFGCTSLL